MKIFPAKIYQYNMQVNTHDLLKLIALLTMTIDHLGYYYWVDCIWFRIIGRMAAPLFFFVFGTAKRFEVNPNLPGSVDILSSAARCPAERRGLKYQQTLMWGMVLTFITYLSRPGLHFNILINFVFIQWFLNKIKPCDLSTIKLTFLFLLCLVFLPFTSNILSYGSCGLLFATSGHLIAQKDKRGIFFMVSTVIIYGFKQGQTFGFFSQWAYGISLVIVCLFLIGMFGLYTFRTWAIPACLKNVSLILARYSLYVYVAQTGLGDLGLWILAHASRG